MSCKKSGSASARRITRVEASTAETPRFSTEPVPWRSVRGDGTGLEHPPESKLVIPGGNRSAIRPAGVLPQGKGIDQAVRRDGVALGAGGNQLTGGIQTVQSLHSVV